MTPYKYIDWSGFPYLLTTEEVSDLFRVNKCTVTRMLNSGELQGAKIGKNWVVPRENVKEYLTIKFKCKEV